jgi:hypothetical protein
MKKARKHGMRIKFADVKLTSEMKDTDFSRITIR